MIKSWLRVSEYPGSERKVWMTMGWFETWFEWQPVYRGKRAKRAL